MKNKEFNDYYIVVLAAAYINVEMLELAGRTPSDAVVARSGAIAGFNKNAFLEDVKAVTNIISARRNADIKFDTPNDNETSND